MPIPNVSSKHCPTLNHLFVVPTSHQRNFVRENKQFVRDISRQQHAKNNPIPIASYAVPTDGPSNLGTSSGRSSTRLIGGKEALKENPPSANSTKSYLRQHGREGQHSIHSREKLPQKTTNAIPPLRRQPASRTTKHKAATLETQNVAVQTEEIRDEIFLYTALKKCATPAFKSALKAKYQQKDEAKQSQTNGNQYPPDEGFCLRPDQVSKGTEIENKMEQHPSARNPLESAKHMPRIHYNPFESGDNVYNAPTDVNDQFNVMTLPPGMRKSCQSDACASCPKGYHLLTENEREQIKIKLLERESLLIKQLNSFPLAIETLRVRQSKTRIEHELSVLEQSLRKLTKKKVYVKQSE